MSLINTNSSPVLESLSWTSSGNAIFTNTEVKSWGKIDGSTEDSLITEIIDEVTDHVITEFGIPLKDLAVTAIYESIPTKVDLPFTPVSAVTTVHTIDGEGTQTLIDSANYYLTGNTLNFTQLLSGRVKVVYVCKYATLPVGLKIALRKAILSALEDRQDLAGGMNVFEMPNASREMFMKWMSLI